MKKLVCAAFAAALFSAGGAQAADKFLADRHAERGMACPVCHAPDMKVKRTDKDVQVCQSCHGNYDKIYEKLKSRYDDKDLVNPHGQHDGNLDCTACHKGHKKGTNYCLSCHSFEYKIP